jgi:intermediate filament protein if
MSAKTTYQRSAKGPISISECAADGKFVALENTGRKEENLDGFKIRRNIDGIDKADFPLDYVTVQPMAKIRVWAAGCRPPNALPTDLEYFDNWGTGSAIKTTLINQLGEDRATHVQKTVYS